MKTETRYMIYDDDIFYSNRKYIVNCGAESIRLKKEKEAKQHNEKGFLMVLN